MSISPGPALDLADTKPSGPHFAQDMIGQGLCRGIIGVGDDVLHGSRNQRQKIVSRLYLSAIYPADLYDSADKVQICSIFVLYKPLCDVESRRGVDLSSEPFVGDFSAGAGSSTIFGGEALAASAAAEAENSANDKAE